MAFRFAHNNFNVVDLEASLKFYQEALGLKEVRRHEAADGSFVLVKSIRKWVASYMRMKAWESISLQTQTTIG